jgi:hypothetical protein
MTEARTASINAGMCRSPASPIYRQGVVMVKLLIFQSKLASPAVSSQNSAPSRVELAEHVRQVEAHGESVFR